MSSSPGTPAHPHGRGRLSREARFEQLLAAASALLAAHGPEMRGFQIHDFLHVITGYDSSKRGELALQAFCLAQIRFPCFGMWLSVVCTRMTFLDPDAIRPAMDAITDGWRSGRQVGNLQFGRWEEFLDVPLSELRARHAIPPEGLAAGSAARA